MAILDFITATGMVLVVIAALLFPLPRPDDR